DRSEAQRVGGQVGGAGRIGNYQGAEFIDRLVGQHRQQRGAVHRTHHRREAVGRAEGRRAVVRQAHRDQVGAGPLRLRRGPAQHKIGRASCRYGGWRDETEAQRVGGQVGVASRVGGQQGAEFIGRPGGRQR